MISDRELLRQYIDQRDENAFTEVVHNHANLVYSAALRITGDPQLAQDVMQTVFSKLARQAKALVGHQSLVGWLHTTTRNAAINAIRGEARRHVREQEALAMQNESFTPAVQWDELRPLLDEAVNQLRDSERQVVLLRFFEGLSHQEVGAALGLTENAVQKRVDRALDKLRAIFSRQGVTVSSTLLAAAICTNSVNAAPVGLAAKVSTTALAGVGSAVADSAFLLSLFYMSTKIKLLVAAVVLMAIASTIAVNWPHPASSAVTAGSSSPTGPTKPTAAVKRDIPGLAVVAPSPPSDVSADFSPNHMVISNAFVATPQVDLKSEVVTALHFMQTQDYASALNVLLAPDVMNRVTQGGNITIKEYVANQSQFDGFDVKNGIILAGLEAAQNQVPVISDDGRQATYTFDKPNQSQGSIQFVNVGGFWYMKTPSNS